MLSGQPSAYPGTKLWKVLQKIINLHFQSNFGKRPSGQLISKVWHSNGIPDRAREHVAKTQGGAAQVQNAGGGHIWEFRAGASRCAKFASRALGVDFPAKRAAEKCQAKEKGEGLGEAAAASMGHTTFRYEGDFPFLFCAADWTDCQWCRHMATLRTMMYARELLCRHLTSPKGHWISTVNLA